MKVSVHTSPSVRVMPFILTTLLQGRLVMLSPFHRWGSRGIAKGSDLLQLTQRQGWDEDSELTFSPAASAVASQVGKSWCEESIIDSIRRLCNPT